MSLDDKVAQGVLELTRAGEVSVRTNGLTFRMKIAEPIADWVRTPPGELMRGRLRTTRRECRFAACLARSVLRRRRQHA